MEIKWNPLKSTVLKAIRGASFEEIMASNLVAIRKHPQYEHQRIMIFEHKGYFWAVPFVIEGDSIFLKTLYPSRKYTRIYKKESGNA